MLTRHAKALYYAFAGPIMAINATRYKAFCAPKSGNRDRIRVHLGPGQRNYLPGWINVDANMFTGKCDVWADLAAGLPFQNDSVDAIYSHHVIEHLPDLRSHFTEMFRILKPGGVFRVGGPHGDNAMRQYLADNAEWFSDFPDKRTSIGGRLENFIFCRREHLTILTPSYLTEIALGCGFAGLLAVPPIVRTRYPEYFDQAVMGKEWESTPEVPHTLLMEGTKPATSQKG